MGADLDGDGGGMGKVTLSRYLNKEKKQVCDYSGHRHSLQR